MTQLSLHLTSAQLKVLDEFNSRFDADWRICEVDDGNIGVQVFPYTLHRSYERCIRTDGTITRYDADTDTEELAEVTPEVGTYQGADRSGKVRQIRFNY